MENLTRKYSKCFGKMLPPSSECLLGPVKGLGVNIQHVVYN